uniref:hypothetical protein n=1 Tax=Candidatus Electronema sp. TaxID=2698783 RepID=UPI004055AE00
MRFVPFGCVQGTKLPERSRREPLFRPPIIAASAAVGQGKNEAAQAISAGPRFFSWHEQAFLCMILLFSVPQPRCTTGAHRESSICRNPRQRKPLQH